MFAQLVAFKNEYGHTDGSATIRDDKKAGMLGAQSTCGEKLNRPIMQKRNDWTRLGFTGFVDAPFVGSHV